MRFWVSYVVVRPNGVENSGSICLTSRSRLNRVIEKTLRARLAIPANASLDFIASVADL